MRADTTYFFMHIMKTAGSSFARHIGDNFAPDEIYPHPSSKGPGHMEQYWEIAALRALSPDQLRPIRIFHGHFPYVVGSMVDAGVTLCLLRDPVDRVISHLRHCERHFPRHHGKSLEEIYEDAWHHPTLFLNYQVKQFALTVADNPQAHIDIIDIDQQRFDLATERLAQVGVLGFTDQYDQFLDDVRQRCGWRVGVHGPMEVAPGAVEVPPALRRRIRSDSASDIAFYEHARSMHRRRAGIC